MMTTAYDSDLSQSRSHDDESTRSNDSLNSVSRSGENEEKIMDFFEKNSGQIHVAPKIAAEIGETKAIVNKTLYQMEGRGRIEKIPNTQPPKWRLIDSPRASGEHESTGSRRRHQSDPDKRKSLTSFPNAVMSRSRHSIETSGTAGSLSNLSLESSRSTESIRSTESNDAREERVLEFLESATNKTASPLAISRKLRETKQQVNSLLYKLEKSKSVEKVSDQPPLWTIPKSLDDAEFNSRFYEEWDVLAYLGSGAFGITYRAKKKIVGKHLAVKRINFKNRPGKEEKKVREVKALAHLEHPSIVRYYDAWIERPPNGWQEEKDKELGEKFPKLKEFDEEDSSSSQIETHNDAAEEALPRNYLYISMEFCDGGSLAEWLTKNKVGEASPEALSIFKQLAAAVEFVHGKGVIHRDIKPDNVFLVDTNDGILVKLGDFGLATEYEEQAQESSGSSGKQIGHTKYIGSDLYFAPEVDITRDYTSAVDVFSLGVVLVELYSNFTTRTEAHINLGPLSKPEFTFPDEFSRNAPQHLQSFANRMLCNDQKKRITMAELNSVKTV